MHAKGFSFALFSAAMALELGSTAAATDIGCVDVGSKTPTK